MWSTKKSTLAHLQESFTAPWYYWLGLNKPKCVFIKAIQNATNKFLRNFYFSGFSTASLTHSFTHSLMRSVKRSGKLATATALLLRQKCLEFCGEKIFHNLKCLCVCTVNTLTVLALILLYGGHCFSVRLPSKVMHGFTHCVRFPASHNNVPQHITMFPDSTIAA